LINANKSLQDELRFTDANVMALYYEVVKTTKQSNWHYKRSLLESASAFEDLGKLSCVTKVQVRQFVQSECIWLP
jgi:hypothetical protein